MVHVLKQKFQDVTDVFFQVVPDLRDPCIETDLSIWILRARVHGVPVMPTILGGLQINRTARTTNFELLISPPSPYSTGRAVGHYCHHKKTPSGLGAHVEAFVDSSLVTTLLAQGICCMSRTSKSFSSFYAWSMYATNCGSLQLHLPLTCMMIS
jgi:hypothetical protein